MAGFVSAMMNRRVLVPELVKRLVIELLIQEEFSTIHVKNVERNKTAYTLCNNIKVC
jgi:hypothetical protein